MALLLKKSFVIFKPLYRPTALSLCIHIPFHSTTQHKVGYIEKRTMSSKDYQDGPSSNDYDKWTRKQLIKKIRELDGIPAGVEKNGQASANSRNGDAVIEDLGEPPLKRAKKKELVFTSKNTRFIALKFAYAGWNYQGLAVQKEETALPTVEQKILDAMHHIKIIPTTDVNDCQFSRCGRTDKGVSAMNQVISLKVRSSLSSEEREDPSNDVREMDYANILNQILPPDIRFHATCLRPPTAFDARFSCRARHYKYIFDSTDLNLEAMMEAAKKFEGVHDFRNFCKVDGAKQISNFVRQIFSSQIIPFEEDNKKTSSKYFVFDLRGRAFLWHQVRCMVAVLLMVGQNFEKPEIVDHLLNVESCPRKPAYVMAHDVPLILYDCEFDDDVHWTPLQITQKTARANSIFKGAKLDHDLKAIVYDHMNEIAIKPFDEKLEDKVLLNNGDGKGRFVNKNIALKDRNTVGTPEEINSKWKAKNGLKKMAKADIDDLNE